jgi:endonuclease/exonuclease/phosphatase family metal-dependent hydrolase
MPQLTIVSFNMHCGLRARRRGVCVPYDLAAVLRSLAANADVLVLQESFLPDGGPSIAQQVADGLGATVFELPFGRAKLVPWPHVPRNGTGSGTVGLAIVSRIPAELQGRLAVGTVAGDPTPERGGLHAKLDVDGEQVDLIGIHLTSRLPYGPPIQLTRLRRQLPPPGGPAIVAGDCNFWGPGVQAFLPGWRRSVWGRTWPARGPHSQIDHILVSPELEVARSEVLPAVGSDHLPVRAVLRVR